MSERSRPPDDMPEQEATEARLLDARFGALLEAAPDAMVIVNRNGVMVLVNRHTERLFGFARDELLGAPVDALVPERFRERHPAHRDGYFAAPHPRPMGAGNDLAGRRKDGSEFPAEISLSPLQTDEGRFAIAAIRDVTDRRKVEARFRGLLEAAPDAMVIVDRDGRIVLVNGQTERLFGYERDELLGAPVEILVPEPARASHPELRRRYFAAPRPRAMGAGVELAARRKDGTEFPAEISLSPLETEEGILVSAAVRDVSDRKRLEEVRRRGAQEHTRRLQAASRFKSEFLANMSHELRTPLNAIIGFAKLMHSGRLGAVSPTHREHLGDILSSAEHLLRLINDVLDLSKIEAGKMVIRVEPVDLTALVEESCNLMGRLAAAKRIRIEAAVEPEVGHVEADPARLRQIVYNYLSNAMKFTPDGGRVAVRARPDGAGLFRIEVEDTGPGIDESDLSRLFVAFEQLDAGAAKRHQGTGLGLALTKRLAIALGGDVGATSRPGAGSAFSVVLPRSPARRPVVPLTEGGTEPPVVLVAAAEVRDRARIVNALSGCGCEILSAQNAARALSVCLQRHVNAVVLELVLSDGTAWDLLRELRLIPSMHPIPVVVATITGEAIAAFPAHAYLPEPISGADLVKTLTRAGVMPRADAGPILMLAEEEERSRILESALATAGFRTVRCPDADSALREPLAPPPPAIVLDLLPTGAGVAALLERLGGSGADVRPPLVIWAGRDVERGGRARRSGRRPPAPGGDPGRAGELLGALRIALAGSLRRGSGR